MNAITSTAPSPRPSPPGETENKLDGSGLHLALLIEEGRGEWHARRIVRSLEAMGARVTVSSLPHCAFDTALASGIDIPGFKGELPDGVFVRSISAGTLEQITFRLGLLHALRDAGLDVPGDVSVVGFDDIPEAAHFWPPLTTVRQDREQMARAAFRRLMERIADPSLPPCDIFLPVSLVERESTGRRTR